VHLVGFIIKKFDTGYYVLFLSVNFAKSYFKSPLANDLIVTSSHYLKPYITGVAH